MSALADTPRLCLFQVLDEHEGLTAEELEHTVQAELDRWSKQDSQKLRTLTGMLQLLQAETRPEAEQPEVRCHHHPDNLHALLFKSPSPHSLSDVFWQGQRG